MAVLAMDGLRRDEVVSALRTENAMLHIQIAQMQADWTRLQEHNAYLRRLYAQQFHNSRKVVDALCSCRQQVRNLRCEIGDLRQLVQSVPIEFLRDAQLRTGKLVSLNKIQVQQKLQQQLMERRAVEDRAMSTQRELHALRQKYEVEKARRKNLHNALVELRGNIRVHCRVRPVLSFDASCKAASSGPDEEVIAADDEETVSVMLRKQTVSGPQLSTKLFEFDHVFGPHDSQGAVFDEVTPLLTSLLDGYNVCIMAYGQTGSGKTHTMLGSNGGCDPACQDGVIPMAAGHLYRLMEEREAEFDASYQVEVTVAEIYMEKIRDLLQHQQGDIWHNVSLGPEGGYDVTTLSSSPAHCPGDVVHLVQVGMQRRAECATDIHQHSSRSHLIVTLTLTGTLPTLSSVPSSISSTPMGSPPGSPLPSRQSSAVVAPSTSTPTKSSASRIPRPIDHTSFGGKIRLLSSAPSLSQSSAAVLPTESHLRQQLQQQQLQAFRAKLQLVDLAGSECVGMSGATGTTLRETQCINKSLSALSDVLGALSHHKSHVPYRNSTLTHLLQSSIGGDSKLMILLCVSPTQRYLSESQRCLQFGSRARQIQRGPAKVKTIAKQH